MSATGEFLREIGGLIESPGNGVVIAFCWVFSWVITWSLVQAIKRFLAGSGIRLSNPRIEVAAIFCAWSVCMLIMVGLYYIDFRRAAIHSILIAMSYQLIVRVGFATLKKWRPDWYNAMRTNRRADDTIEMTAEDLKP